MKKVLLSILMMVSTIVVAQTNLLGQSGFDGLTDVVKDCNGGENYSGTQSSRVNPVTGGSLWFKCGGKADVTNLTGNDVARFLDGGSTPIRQLVEGLTPSSVYKISIKVSKATADTNRPITLIMKPFDNTNAENLAGWSEVVSNSNVTVSAGSVVIATEAFDNTGFTNFEFYFTAPQSNVILQVQSAKEGSAESGKDTYADDVTMVLDNTAGVEDLQKFNFSYAPNPSKDFVRLSAVNTIQNVEIFNLLGQKMINKELNSNNETVDVSNLVNGIYIMNVTIDGVKGSFKIIKE